MLGTLKGSVPCDSKVCFKPQRLCVRHNFRQPTRRGLHGLLFSQWGGGAASQGSPGGFSSCLHKKGGLPVWCQSTKCVSALLRPCRVAGKARRHLLVSERARGWDGEKGCLACPDQPGGEVWVWPRGKHFPNRPVGFACFHVSFLESFLPPPALQHGLLCAGHSVVPGGAGSWLCGGTGH